MRISDWSSDVCSSDLHGDGAIAGDDSIVSGDGNDTVAGGSLAHGVGYAYAETNNTASDFGSAGNDDVDTGESDDSFSGDSLAIETDGVPVDSTAYTTNVPTEDGVAGSEIGRASVRERGGK